jgi:Rap1a immunity proteins
VIALPKILPETGRCPNGAEGPQGPIGTALSQTWAPSVAARHLPVPGRILGLVLLQLFIGILTVQPALADPLPQYQSAGGLLKVCRDEDLELACTGYIAGYLDTDFAVTGTSKSKPKMVCLPARYALFEAKALVVQRLREIEAKDAKLLDRPAPPILFLTFASRYPCVSNGRR